MSETSKRLETDDIGSPIWGSRGTNGRVEFHIPSQTEAKAESRERTNQLFRICHNYQRQREAFQTEFLPIILCRSLRGREEFKERLRSLSEINVDFSSFLFREFDWCVPTKSLIPRFRFIEFKPEVKDLVRQDKFLRNVLDKAVMEIHNLDALKDESFLLTVSIDFDIEIPEWKEVVLTLHVEKRDFDQKMRLWESIEQKVRTRIEEMRNLEEGKTGRGEIIDRINQNLAIEIVEVSF